MSASAVVIGDALIDELRDEDGSSDHVGGAALNVAVGLSILGLSVSLIAMVGDDADGDSIRSFLHEHGVALIETDAPNGSSRAVSDRTSGEPRYSFNDAAKHRRIRFDTDARAALDAADAVLVSCFPFDDQPQFDELVSAIHSPGTRLFVDPNPRSGMMSDREIFVRNFESIAAESLLVKVGDDDSALLYGGVLVDLRERLIRDGARMVLATAGSLGADLQTAGGSLVHQPIARFPGPIVDTMGAGDATLAAVANSLVTGPQPVGDLGVADLQRILADAMLIAAATCRSDGALLRQP